MEAKKPKGQGKDGGGEGDELDDAIHRRHDHPLAYASPRRPESREMMATNGASHLQGGTVGSVRGGR